MEEMEIAIANSELILFSEGKKWATARGAVFFVAA